VPAVSSFLTAAEARLVDAEILFKESGSPLPS
jgi:hypothetical protein